MFCIFVTVIHKYTKHQSFCITFVIKDYALGSFYLLYMFYMSIIFVAYAVHHATCLVCLVCDFIASFMVLE